MHFYVLAKFFHFSYCQTLQTNETNEMKETNRQYSNAKCLDTVYIADILNKSSILSSFYFIERAKAIFYRKGTEESKWNSSSRNRRQKITWRFLSHWKCSSTAIKCMNYVPASVPLLLLPNGPIGTTLQCQCKMMWGVQAPTKEWSQFGGGGGESKSHHPKWELTFIFLNP